MSGSCLFGIMLAGSVKLMFITVGSVPPATWAWKVWACQLVSVDFTVMFGFFAVKSAIFWLNAFRSFGLSGVGRSPIVMVTGAFWSISPPAPDADGVVPFAQPAAASTSPATPRAAPHLLTLVIGTPQVSGCRRCALSYTPARSRVS